MKVHLLIIGLLISGISIAQEISTTNSDTHVWEETGSDEANELSSHIDVVNTHSEELTLKVKREVITAVTGATNQFCWGGLCYPPTTDESVLTQAIPAGETATSEATSGFTGYYRNNGNNGLQQIKYIFFEEGNTDNKTEIIVNYCVDTQAACETVLGTNEIVSEPELNAAPNPASNSTVLSYDLGSSSKDAKLTIRNALGKVVKEVSLDSSKGVVLLDLSDFDSGMYFYSLLNENSLLSTKRLIVTN